MRTRRFLFGSLVATVTLGLLPAHLPARAQTTFVGVCLGGIQLRFANEIQILSGPTTLTSLSSNSSCVTNADNLQKTLTLTGSGNGVITQCGAIVVNGVFTATFSPLPAPPPSNGVFTYVGTSSGGLLRLAGQNPTLHGIGTLVGGGAVACAQGASNFTFQMAMPFVDP